VLEVAAGEGEVDAPGGEDEEGGEEAAGEADEARDAMVEMAMAAAAGLPGPGGGMPRKALMIGPAGDFGPMAPVDDDEGEEAADGAEDDVGQAAASGKRGVVSQASPSASYCGWVRLPLHLPGRQPEGAASSVVGAGASLELRITVTAAGKQARIRAVRVVAARCRRAPRSAALLSAAGPSTGWLVPLRAPALELFRSLAGKAVAAVARAGRDGASQPLVGSAGDAGDAMAAPLADALLFPPAVADSASRAAGVRTLRMVAAEAVGEAHRLRRARTEAADAFRASATGAAGPGGSGEKDDDDGGKQAGGGGGAAAASAAGAAAAAAADAADAAEPKPKPKDAAASATEAADVAAAADTGVDDAYAFELVAVIAGLARDVAAADAADPSFGAADRALGPLAGTLAASLLHLLAAGTARVQRASVRALSSLLPLTDPAAVDAAAAQLAPLEVTLGPLAGAASALAVGEHDAITAAAGAPPSQAQEASARSRADGTQPGAAVGLLLLVAGTARAVQVRGSAAGRTVRFRTVASGSSGLPAPADAKAAAAAADLLASLASLHEARIRAAEAGCEASLERSAADAARAAADDEDDEADALAADAAPGRGAAAPDAARGTRETEAAVSSARRFAELCREHVDVAPGLAVAAVAPGSAPWPALAGGANAAVVASQSAVSVALAASAFPALPVGASHVVGGVRSLAVQRACAWAASARAAASLSLATSPLRVAGVASAPARAAHSPAFWHAVGALSLAGRPDAAWLVPATAAAVGPAAPSPGSALVDPVLGPGPGAAAAAAAGARPVSGVAAEELLRAWVPAIEASASSSRSDLSWARTTVFSDSSLVVLEVRRDPARAARGEAEAERCRFCQCELTPDRLPDSPPSDAAFANVCRDAVCQMSVDGCCTHFLSCGHPCGGVRGEAAHLPCFFGCDGVPMAADDLCVICTDRLDAMASIRLDSCGHVVHADCAKQQLAVGWAGARINFRFLGCPSCGKLMEHPALAEAMAESLALRESVRGKARMRLQYMGLDGHKAVTDPASPWFRRPVDYALHRFAYYRCHKCKDPYYGGEANCEAGMEAREVDETELVCPKCQPFSAETCTKHGLTTWKCRFCCSEAVFFCFGTTHFCEQCHNDPGLMQSMEAAGSLPTCPAGPRGKKLEGDCPLGIAHPPTGTEFCLGCPLCAQEKTF